jgi:predicted Zn-dependent protease
MDRTQRERIATRTIGFATTPCEALVFSNSIALTRFTQNAIHQNLASDDTVVRVRVIDAGRTGVAQTNDLSDASLEATVRRAHEIAQFAPVDLTSAPLANAPASANLSAPPAAFDSVTASAPPERRAEIVAAMLAPMEPAGLWAAGYATTGSDGVSIANTAGTFASFDGTNAALSIKANGADSTGYAECFATTVGALDGASSGSLAAHRAASSAQPAAVEPGAWTVILEPPAFGELLSYLTDHFGAQAVDEGSSFLCDGLDRRYAHENFTLHDDFAHPLHSGMPFDYEGYERKRVALVEGGIARDYVTDATWAAKLGRRNTGHGMPAPSAEGPQPLHFVVATGTKTVEQLIAESERALLISRFWYIRPIDHRKTIVTGMTRDGVFEIEGGRIKRGVRNMRFNQSILGALGNVECANVAHRTGGYGYSIVTPAVKMAEFRFSSVTEF